MKDNSQDNQIMNNGMSDDAGMQAPQDNSSLQTGNMGGKPNTEEYPENHRVNRSKGRSGSRHGDGHGHYSGH